MSGVINERLLQVEMAARKAPHGSKTAIYQRAAEELGMSIQTLLRRIGQLVSKKPRKRRADAGQTALTRDEALLISATLIESTRKNDKQLLSIPDAVLALRSNGWIVAGRLDEETGELIPLSDSAIARALRGYGLHPDQLLQPTPATDLASRHPNHVWEIDASLCVMYYLKTNRQQESGLRVMDHKKFYKNKPKNLASIASDRVWSYEITDHTSGWVYVEYVLGAESGENLCSVLINAMQERGNGDLLHGVPRILLLDPGSANTAAMTRNLCRSLGIRLIPHAPGNARATGQVENARNIIERKFEPNLKFRPIHSLEELNERATKWRIYFNHQAKHSRHGMSRSAVWMKIKPEQLIKAPSVEVCRDLAVTEPMERTVTPSLHVSFQGQDYDVSSVPGVMVGEKLRVTRNPWRDDAAQIVLIGEDGYEYYLVVPQVPKDEFGFSVNAVEIGEAYRQPASTLAQLARQEIEQLVTGTDTPAAAEAARKAKSLPFNGQFDPLKPVDDTIIPTYLPRHGTTHSLSAPRIEFPPLSHVEAAKQLRPLLSAAGHVWSPERFTWLQTNYPDGVPADALDEVVTRMIAAASPGLRIVNG